MPKKTRRTPGKQNPSRGQSTTALTKAKLAVEVPTAYPPEASNRFVMDLLTRGEAGTLKNGKLPLGKTHIIEKKKGGIKLTRARFSVTG